MTNVPVEITLNAQHRYADPFNEITLDVVFTEPSGTARRVPAFWAGGERWKARYSSPTPGRHRWRSECSNVSDSGLHGVEGAVEIAQYSGRNPLFRHGPLRVAAGRRHLEHLDGTPFFWLGDTWWMGLCGRLGWPADFKQLAADRTKKGFNVIQIVAGLYPDMFPFDQRGANEAGYPWEHEYARVNPAYFDAADRRLRYLVDRGLTPCIVGAWGYFLPWMGEAKMKAHWRYLIARYGAWPVVWCAAGEANLPWYLAKGFPYDDRGQVHDWTGILRFIRETDSFHRLLTIHPTGIGRLSARNATDDSSLLDFDMLQTPHGQREAVPPTVRTVRESYPDRPTMPIINGEASYEMLMDRIPAEWPRAMFWVCMMNGAAGHTYGANGIWQVNRPGKPHGASPHGSGNGYGVISWEEAMRLPGSRQTALGKKFLESLPWTRLQPMPGTARWADPEVEVSLGNWIWYPEGHPHRDAPVEARFFRKAFDLPSLSIRRALLTITADDRFTVWLNGRKAGSGDDWRNPARIDVAPRLRTGANLLAVRAENGPAPAGQNPAGLNAALVVDFTDGTNLTIRTDTSWKVSRAFLADWLDLRMSDADWPAAMVAAREGEPPWGSVESKVPVEPQACGIPDGIRIVYLLDPRPVVVKALRRNTTYRVTYFDPVSGARAAQPAVTADPSCESRFQPPAHGHDWLILLEPLPARK